MMRFARRPLIGGLAAALVLVLATPMALQARGKGPDVIADLAEEQFETVVNISTTQRVEANRSSPMPQLPEGSPFREFFEDFFNRRGPGQGPGQGQGPQQGQPQIPGQPPGGGNGQNRASSLGSGFVIDPSGIIITNNHVIENADEITANFANGTRLRAEVVGRDPRTDIAVLRVQPPAPLKAARFGDSERTRVGEWVMAIGNPFGLGGSVTAGIISARNRDINSGPYDNFIQTDAAINRGNSGGPLFNMNGEVIGINTAIISPSGGSIGIGFAIPSSLAQTVIAQLREFGETRRGWLGVRIQGVSEDIAQSLGLPRARGAMIAGVTADGPAAKGGILVGDVIVRFNGREVAESRDLPRIVADAPVNQEVPVTVFRRGAETEVRVVVGRLEENDANQRNARAQPNQPAPRPAPAATIVSGMALSSVTADLRRQYRLGEDVRGVVVTRVEPGSPAAERRVVAGEVIVEVNQQAVAQPADIQRQVEALRGQGRRTALFLIANAQGEQRFVAIAITP